MFLPARPRSFVCLSVCLCARLLKNACMDLDEMLRVDNTGRGTWKNLLTFEPDPDDSRNRNRIPSCRNRIPSSDIV